MDTPLEPGDELHCPHCHGWHQVAGRHTEGTEFTRTMLYFASRQGQYYAGQGGHQADTQPDARLRPAD